MGLSPLTETPPDRRTTSQVTCKCDALYERTEFHSAPREADSFVCPACGHTLALQLSLFEVSALSFRLVGSAPERPCDDVCGLNPLLSESDGDAADFLD